MRNLTGPAGLPGTSSPSLWSRRLSVIPELFRVFYPFILFERIPCETLH